MPEYTTTEAAEILNTNRRNVQNYAKRHGLRKFGREYIVTETDLEGMKNELGKPGVKPRIKPTNVANERGRPANGNPPTAPESQETS